MYVQINVTFEEITFELYHVCGKAEGSDVTLCVTVVSLLFMATLPNVNSPSVLKTTYENTQSHFCTTTEPECRTAWIPGTNAYPHVKK